MSLLILDNYDSFTYNLVHLLEKCGVADFCLRQNDAIDVDTAAQFDSILLSPGPGLPSEAGIMPDILRSLSGTKKILGVCLGMQAIGECFGGQLKNLPVVAHGVASQIAIKTPDPLFINCPMSFTVGRYHSWVVDRQLLPTEMEVIAEDKHGEIMALRHRRLNVRGVQFHPESILSEFGEQIISNWLNHC